MLPLSAIGLTPVAQRVEGYPFGECVRASYAALFDLPIEVVPRFDPAALKPGETQRARERRWLAALGLDLVEISTQADYELPEVVLHAMPKVYHLISGISPRGLGHRCVGFAGQVVHDPHPSGAGLSTIYSVGLLVPL